MYAHKSDALSTRVSYAALYPSKYFGRLLKMRLRTMNRWYESTSSNLPTVNQVGRLKSKIILTADVETTTAILNAGWHEHNTFPTNASLWSIHPSFQLTYHTYSGVVGEFVGDIWDNISDFRCRFYCLLLFIYIYTCM